MSIVWMFFRMIIRISWSLRLDGLRGNTITCAVVETRQANLTSSILPGGAILHLAASLHQLVFLVALLALQALQIHTAFHIAAASLELEVRKTISTLSTLISHAT
jgi:hypothetical protein